MGLRPEVPLIYVGDYTTVGSVAGGTLSAPEWSSDSYTTPGTTTGRVTFCDYVKPPGAGVGAFYYGDNLGRIFLEDETGEVPFVGVGVIVPSHNMFGEPGGDRDEGKKLTRLWSYLVSEDSDWILRLWPGDEYAYAGDQTLNQPIGGFPQGFSNYATLGVLDNVEASRLEEPTVDGDRLIRYQPKVVHQHDTSGAPHSGRGFTLEFLMVDPAGAFFLGYGGVWEPGGTSRPMVAETPYEE